MTIQLPEEIEGSILAEVRNGRFASVDDALAQAWRVYRQQPKPPMPSPGLGSIGAMREDAEFLDQAVEHAMKVREERPWRLPPDE